MTDSTDFGGWVRPDERPFVRRAIDWVASVQTQSQWKLTDFLTPREQYLLVSVVNREGAQVALDGGQDHAERKRALIMPDNWYPERDDFKLTLLSATLGNSGAPTHGSVLGSVLGTGIDRRKIGDIAIENHAAFILVCSEVTAYLTQSWTHIGSEPISLTECRKEIVLPPPEYRPESISVLSMRADAVVAHACHWSRAAAQAAIAKGAVSLNFTELQKVEESLDVGDILSVRGFGRIRILALEGESKKGRTRLSIGILKSSHR